MLSVYIYILYLSISKYVKCIYIYYRYTCLCDICISDDGCNNIKVQEIFKIPL